jgi:hypothetical protein
VGLKLEDPENSNSEIQEEIKQLVSVGMQELRPYSALNFTLLFYLVLVHPFEVSGFYHQITSACIEVCLELAACQLLAVA